MFWSKCKRTRSKTQKPGVGYESLEKRQLLAGDITATFDTVTHNLTLVGDSLNNQVTIDTVEGGFSITGNNGTTINGLPSMTVASPDIRQFVSMLGLGNDTLKVNNVVLNTFNLTELGAGADTTEFLNVKAKSNVSISTLAGQDTVKLATGAFAGNVTIDTDRGNDEVWVSNTRLGVVMDASGNIDPNYVFGGATGGGKNLRIQTGLGEDVVTLQTLEVDGIVNILTGENNDTVNFHNLKVADRLNTWTGAGDDLIAMVQTTCPEKRMWLEAGQDIVQIDQFSQADYWRVDGGLGNDIVDRNGGSGGILVNVESF